MRLITVEISAGQDYWLENMLSKMRVEDRDIIIRRALDFCASQEADFFKFLNGKT